MIYVVIFDGTMTRRVKLLTLAALVPPLAYLGLVLLTPTFGRIVCYADQQPSLRITGQNVEKPLRFARLLFDARPHLRDIYWPEPSAIEEKEKCWLVTFSTKTPIYSFLGFKQSLRPTDPAMYISIDKADYRARFGNWCQ